MLRPKSDLCLIYKNVEDKLIAVTGRCSDEALSFSTRDVMHETDRTFQEFESGNREYHNNTFFGIRSITDAYEFYLFKSSSFPIQNKNTPNRC